MSLSLLESKHKEAKQDETSALIKSDNRFGLVDRLHFFRKKLDYLSNILIQQHKNRCIDNALLGEWLQLSNVINMDKVCQAFYRGNLFYTTDNYHFAGKNNFKEYESLTTVPQLEPIAYEKKANHHVELCREQYVIGDSCSTPSKVMQELLFSYTAMDCTASITVVYYLTLLDLFQVIDRNTKRFDELFEAKSDEVHNLNRLRLGMGLLSNPNNVYVFNPLGFFHDYKKVPSLKEIQMHPERYIGMRIYINGVEDYFDKHEDGSAQGWNVVVLGLDSRFELLFLIANEQGKQYVCSYSELVSLLTYSYNLFSEKNNACASKISSEQGVGQFDGYIDTFDVTKINKLLCDFDKTKQSLKNYCDAHYQKILKSEYAIISTPKHPSFVSKGIVKKIKDDQEIKGSGFFKAYRKDVPSRHTLDDFDIDYRDPSRYTH